VPNTYDIIDSWRNHGDYNSYIEIPAFSEGLIFKQTSTQVRLNDYYYYSCSFERVQIYFENTKTHSPGHTYLLSYPTEKQMILTFTGNNIGYP